MAAETASADQDTDKTKVKNRFDVPVAGRDERFTEISDWIIEASLAGIEADRLVKGFCERLVSAGVPVSRAHVACSLLHPMFRAFSVSWNPDRGVERNRFTHATG